LSTVKSVLQSILQSVNENLDTLIKVSTSKQTANLLVPQFGDYPPDDVENGGDPTVCLHQ